MWHILFFLQLSDSQKQPSRGVLIETCSENVQQIYRRTPMPMYDFKKVALQLYWNRTSAWVFSCIFAAYFQSTFLSEYPWRAASGWKRTLYYEQWPKVVLLKSYYKKGFQNLQEIIRVRLSCSITLQAVGIHLYREREFDHQVVSCLENSVYMLRLRKKKQKKKRSVSVFLI